MDRRILFQRLLLSTALLWLSAPARADEHYAFDKTHSVLGFAVQSFGVSEVTGVFSKYDGDFVFCLEHPDKNKISLTLYSDGIHTPEGKLDGELQGPHLFNAAQFPRMQFASTRVKLTDKNNAEVLGNLTLLGVTKPVALHVHFLKKEFEPKSGEYAVSFSAFGVIKRSDFGMNYLTPMIGNEVRLQIKVKGVDDDDDDDKPAAH